MNLPIATTEQTLNYSHEILMIQIATAESDMRFN